MQVIWLSPLLKTIFPSNTFMHERLNGPLMLIGDFACLFPLRQLPHLSKFHPGLHVVYANLARISHSPADIVIDFAQILPGETKATVQARVLMSPLSAKLLMRALVENLARYESVFGEINIPTNSSLAENLFRPHQPPEPPGEDKA